MKLFFIFCALIVLCGCKSATQNTQTITRVSFLDSALSIPSWSITLGWLNPNVNGVKWMGIVMSTNLNFNYFTVGFETNDIESLQIGTVTFYQTPMYFKAFYSTTNL